MDILEDPLIQEIMFSLTAEHECSYIADKQAVTLFVSPGFDITMSHYDLLSQLGFRRSGDHVYRPHCDNCGLCIPVRIPVKQFKPNRSQRRNLKLNQDLDIQQLDPVFKEEHFSLYQKYMRSRHTGGGMDNDDMESYTRLLSADWSSSALLEFKLDSKPVMIAVVDLFENGISAVYTFFDPDISSRGPGVFAILSEIEFVKSQNQEYLYLGYWNPRSKKMSYKSNYQPMEFFDGHEWHPMADDFQEIF